MRTIPEILADCDERERAARKATPGPWRWWTSNSYERLSSDATGKDGDVLHAVVYRDGVPGIEGSGEDRAHIATNHPAAVLQACADTRDLVRRVEEGNAELRRMVDCAPRVTVGARTVRVINSADMCTLGDVLDDMRADAARWKALAEQLAGAARNAARFPCTGRRPCVELFTDRAAWCPHCEAREVVAAFDAATRPQTTAPPPDFSAAFASEMRDLNPVSPALAAYDADGLARMARLTNGKGE